MMHSEDDLNGGDDNTSVSECESLATALCSAYDLDALQILLLYKLNQRVRNYIGPNDTWPVAVYRIINGAARDGWLDGLVREAAQARLEDQELQRLTDPVILSQLQQQVMANNGRGGGELKGWCDSWIDPRATPAPKGLSWYELATSIFGSSKDAETDRIKRAFCRDAGTMVYDKLPITGNMVSTKAINLGRLDIAYLQSPNAVMKLIRFSVPRQARQVRIPSNRLLDDASSNPFIPPTMAIIKTGSDFVERPINDVVQSLADQPRWPLSAKDESSEFFSLTLYDNEHFFPIRAKGDNTGAVIGDIAGRVAQLNFAIGGYFESIAFEGFYEMPSVSPLVFVSLNTAQIQPLSSQTHVRSTFLELIDWLRLRQDNSESTSGQVHKMLDVWANAMDGKWTGATLESIDNDIMIHLSGGFKTASSSQG